MEAPEGSTVARWLGALTSPEDPHPERGQVSLWILAAVAAALAGLSLIASDQVTSVDPDNWLIWSGQLATGHSLSFKGAPSWHPLPVFVTLPFSAISPYAASLAWLWVARFGALMASAFLYLLAARRFGVVAGLIAAVLPFGFALWGVVSIDGLAEPLCTAFLLASVYALLRERPALAVWLLAGAAMVRPETWALLIALCGWQVYRGEANALIRAFAAIGFVAAGWFLAPLVLGGELLHLGALEILAPGKRSGIVGLIPLRVWIPILVGIYGVLRVRDRSLMLVCAASAALAIQVEVLHALGFEGSDRYHLPGAIALCALAGAGVGTVIDLLGPRPAKAAAAAVGLMLAASLVVPQLNYYRDTVNHRNDRAARYERAVEAFESAGGFKRFGGCEPFIAARSTLLARLLGKPLTDFVQTNPAPAVLFRELGASSAASAALRVTGPKAQAHGRVVGYAAPDWAIVYFPGANGCS